MQLSPIELTDKVGARRHFKHMRALMSGEQKKRLDLKLCERIYERVTEDSILLFHPLKNEPSLLTLAERWLLEGKRLAFPISNTATNQLDFRYVGSLDELCQGAYGIFEPPLSAPRVEDHGSSVCIVPALAIDKRGFRLGYGKGYYDRFLSSVNIKSIGVVWSDFLVKNLPTNEYDVPLDEIITEKGVIPINAEHVK